ncbi:hypothetical protein J3S89_13410 [Pinisolibacter sp. B13]|nr:hypothetical protein [Pinisolibacter aquiterrae]
MGDELQDEALRRRPRQRRADRRPAPGLEIGEIGGERAQRVLADAPLCQMAQRGDVVVGEDGCETTAPIGGKNGSKRIEGERAFRLRAGDQGADAHRLPPSTAASG